MRLFIYANTGQENELRLKCTSAHLSQLTFSRQLPGEKELENYDAFFLLEKLGEINFQVFGGKAVIINATILTLDKMLLPNNVSRINGWSGFLQREIWEVATHNQDLVKKVFRDLDWKIIFVKDKPGLVAAKVICMIINEACFAINEKVSTRDEIDVAMQLGTNYPLGPFAWAEKIGLENVYELLHVLSENDIRYTPAFTIVND